MIYDDDDGQIDGDFAGSVNFTPNTAQPWLRSGMPPWHLWGNSQTLITPVQSSAIAQRPYTQGQLVKVAYKRPQTWHWLFSAKLIDGPNSSANSVQLEVSFDLVIGVGRSVIRMDAENSAANGNLNQAFESYFFQWGPLAPFPRAAQTWTSEVVAPPRILRTDPPFENLTGNAVPPAQSASTIDRIVAQDIQLNCRVLALAQPGNTAIGQNVSVEVSAAFAPVTHVRPDWYRKGPPEIAFAGDEIEGR